MPQFVPPIPHIGKHSYSSQDLYVANPKETVIGSFVSIANRVRLGHGTHPLDYLSTSPYLYLDSLEFKTSDTPSHNEWETLKPIRIGNDVLEFDDSDNSASDGIRKARQKYPNEHLVFANGGDRGKDSIPEITVCQECHVDLAFGIGGTNKANSSSWILNRWNDKD